MWRYWNIFTFFLGMENGTTSMENNMVSPQKLTIELSRDTAIPLLGTYPPKIESSDLNRDLYTCVYSIIHNRQGVEPIQVLINRQVDKQTVVYTNTRIFKILNRILKKDGNSGTCYNMDKPWGYNIQWNKSVTQGRILLWFSLSVELRVIKLKEIENRMVISRYWREGVPSIIA